VNIYNNPEVTHFLPDVAESQIATAKTVVCKRNPEQPLNQDAEENPGIEQKLVLKT
jgi:hypothetical protein